ncbi:uncharacterized protein At4g04775-like [Brassica napus]|uniref:uncharacterized protein At4g04775-like n=1 Tax=Brassica napus TaxID=3708 RepID=UPI002078FD61|nr:uncharacterized protein At4g04775-like [Brassica napus]
MSGDSSNTSGVSTGVSSSRRRGGVINGIPKSCWCGEETLPLMSKSDKNPYRRYFRCAYAARKKLENDNHIFKWIDEALINEVEKLEFKNARLEEELREMRRNEILLGERVQMNVEKELFDKVEEVLAEAKGSMKKTLLSAVIGGVVLVGIMELCLKSW